MKRVLLAFAVLALAGCGGGGGTTTSTSAPTTTESSSSSATPGTCTKATPHQHQAGGYTNQHLKLDPSKTYKLVFHTNCGDFTVTLDPKSAPNATASMVSLAKRGYFNDTFFHRIVPGFVIQGGDPTGTGTGGPGYETHDKVAANVHYTHGVVAMAKAGTEPAGTAGSQFFVVTSGDAGLTPDYAIIGKVTSGLGVVDQIGTYGDQSEQPTVAVVISKVDVES